MRDAVSVRKLQLRIGLGETKQSFDTFKKMFCLLSLYHAC